MRADSKPVCYVPHKELPLAHRRFLCFLLRLRRDVLALLEPVSAIHPFHAYRDRYLDVDPAGDAHGRAEYQVVRMAHTTC